MAKTIMISAAALALFTLILLALRVPMPPMLIAPRDGSVVNPAMQLDFEWRYGGMIYRQPVVWRRANYFVVCVQEYTTLDDMKCEYPPNPGSGPPWAAPVTDFASVSAAPDTRWSNLIRFYSHTVDQLPPDLHGKELMWTVAACASTSPRSCNQAIPAWRFQYGLPNLVALSMNEDLLQGSDLPLNATFSNEGDAPSGPFDIIIRVVQFQPNGSRPNRNVNAANATDEVLMTDGRILTAGQLGSPGARDATGVFGILLAGGLRQDLTDSHAGLAAGQMDSWHPTITLPLASSPGVIGYVLMLDPTNMVQETNEDDNTDFDRGNF